jgi:hypothetical protein
VGLLGKLKEVAQQIRLWDIDTGPGVTNFGFELGAAACSSCALWMLASY